jgi:Cytochrome b5-like Heme/Steroid binding domain
MSKLLQSNRSPSSSTNKDMASSSSLSSSLWKQPITWLSAMWFGLCASLVHKYNDLIGIFISFLVSFGLAWWYQQIIKKPSETIQSTASSIQSSNASVKSKTSSRKSRDSTTTVPKSNIKSSSLPNSEWKNFHGNIQDMVGLTTCLVSLFLMQQQKQQYGMPFSEFHALTISTGYLAFALWYSALFCRPIPPPILSILEDCITLTVLLVYLTRYQSSLSNFHSWIQSWIIYKTLALLLSIATRHFMSTKLPSTSSSPKSTTIWTIHGVDFDLTDFVHPGGSEALELGRGRDCSALFESYHPFTEKHWYGYYCWSVHEFTFRQILSYLNFLFSLSWTLD